MSRRRKREDDDDDDILDDEEEEEEKAPAATKKRKKKLGAFLDDAAVESGEEDNEDDDDDDEEDNNEYVKDGFLVDEDEDDVVDKSKSKDDLEDSDEDDDDDDDDEDEDRARMKKAKKSRFTKLRQTERLAEEDLELIREAQGLGPSASDRHDYDDAEDRPVHHIKARNEAELQKTLFDEGEDDDALDDGGHRGAGSKQSSSKPAQQSAKRQEPRRRAPVAADRYDEDGMDDFIEDDLNDQDDIRASEQRGMMDDDGYMGNEVSEAQLNLASEIFGSDYLDFMNRDDDAAGDDRDEEDLLGRRRERDYYDDDHDGDDESDGGSMFDAEEDEDDMNLDGLSEQQKAEALKLKREKSKLARQERRKKAQQTKTEKRKAQLRRVFEPVQLIENFCTERDDQIRQTDIPERMFAWTNSTFYGPPEYASSGAGSTSVDAMELTELERQQAEWIAKRIPAIAEEFYNNSSSSAGGVMPMDLGDSKTALHEEAIITSIAYSLRYIHKDKMEPAFIKRYRKDYVISQAVRDHLYEVAEEDMEWDRLVKGRAKVQDLLSSITAQADGDAQSTVDSDRLGELRDKLDKAKQSLDDSQARASTLKAELDALGKTKGENDDDDQLFDDDDEEEVDEEEKAKEKARVSSSLRDVEELVSLRSERVTQFQSQLDLLEAQSRALNEKGPMERVMTKMRRQALWNDKDYRDAFLAKLEDAKEVVDLNGYLQLIQEGNDAIKKKELPILAAGDGTKESRRRSRRFDRDYYRTCVAEGLRAVCYKFLLPPNRVGIKLEDSFVNSESGGAFDFTRTMPGEEGNADPLQWVPPQIPQSPTEFSEELIGSGELVLLSNSTGNSNVNAEEEKDALRGCRYVAALELASEPRVRKYMRQLYRQNTLLTTRPTAKGLEELDAFHDYYGLHLVRNKPTQEHFPSILVDTPDQVRRRAHMSLAEQHELDTNRRQRQIDSCLQYLNIIKSMQAGFLTFHVHLPLLHENDRWYQPDNPAFANSNRAEHQNIDILGSVLERVYLPPDGDTDAWNEERKQVIRLALTNFLLPYLEAELRRDLMDVASRVGTQAAAANLREMALEGPYRPDRQQPPGLYYNESRFIVPTGDLSVVGYCCSPEGNKDASYFAHVYQNGKAEDFLAVPSGTRVETGKMREKVIMFLIKARPAVVAVGTSGGFESRMIYRRLTDLINEAKQRWSNRFIQGDDEDDEAFRTRQENLEALTGHNDFEDDVEWKCDVDLIDDKVAQLFGRSVRGKKEFPDFPVNHKTAIAMGRYAKDPLAELTYTWSVASDAGVFGTEMLYFNIHPLQQLLPRAMLLREYERVLCDVTADVGADVNATCSFDNLCGLLMFIPGLGPRKAANLKQMISDKGVVSRRRDLLEDRLMGPVVYNNSVAFLRIQQTDQLIDQQLHPLDNTRLHPAIYVQHDWAVKISFDALERENVKSRAIKALTDAMSNSQQEVARLLEATQAEWERNFQSPFRFKEWDPRVNVPAEHWADEIGNLDLDAFANAIEEKGHGRWNSHFEMLLWEFRLPFFDPRKPMELLEGEKLFQLITNESDQSLRPGKEVTGKVVNNGEFGSRVKLEGDIPAFIPLRNLSDEHVEAPEDIVSPGQVVTAIVTEVKKDHMTVDMSLRMEDFRKNPSSWERPLSLPRFDPYFDMAAASRIEDENNKKREAHLEALQLALNRTSGDGAGTKRRAKRVARRACTHPAFRNAQQAEVDKEIREGGAAMVGEALIRPSSKQSDSLAIHWVVKEGSVKVIEVLEEDKETDAAIGNTLKIKDETYGSIDELLGRYVEPMNDFVDELQNHRKFSKLSEDDVDEKLKGDKKKIPASIPYALCWADAHPGYASLRFISNANPRQHPIGISPKGFVWSSKVFLTVEQLINDFKRNPRGEAGKKKPTSTSNEASSSAPPPPRPQAAPAPPRPAPPPKPNRWGTKATIVGAAAAPPAAPSASPSPWHQQQPPPPPRPTAPVTAGWGTGPPPPAAPTGWSQPQPPQQQPPPPRPPAPRPPMQDLPPPPSYVPAPNVPRPMIPNVPPPPMVPPPPVQQPPPQRPPPPLGAQQPPLPPGDYRQQPPPPTRPAGQPPAFGSGPGQPSVGRGRGRTLPAWMAKQQSEA